MSEFNVGDKVYLEGKINDYDENDNTYCLDYLDYRKETHSTVWVKGAVLHSADEAYNEGLNDGWELVKRITLMERDGGYSCEEIENIFGYRNPASVFKAFTPRVALAKEKAYEKRNEIKVGDVVRFNRIGCKTIVTRITETYMCCLFKNGDCRTFLLKDKSDGYVKTGRHFDSIDEFMRSEE